MTPDFIRICSLCDRIETFATRCHYINCPYRKKGEALPVRAVPPKTRTLWTLPQDGTTSMAHKPFSDMFTGELELQPHSVIQPQDVVFFDGGTDVDPKLYGEDRHVMTGVSDKARDAREKHAFLRAQAAGAACLGVCRGAQFLTVMSGGKLVQHVSGHNGGGHMIIINDGRCIYSESSHHQVMWPNEIPHIKIAWASQLAQQKFVITDEYGKDFEDGELPEIIFCKDTNSLCIQGHSEWMGSESEFTKMTRELVKEFLIEGR